MLSLLLLSLLLPLWLFLPSAGADATLEILNLAFPTGCGAAGEQEIGTCTRCHAPPEGQRGSGWQERSLRYGSLLYRKAASLEETRRITVTVPAENLTPGQMFHQEIAFRGNRIFFVYGYRKDGGPFQAIDTAWILDSPRDRFLMRHDGMSLPLLTEPGEYVFAVKLLHDRRREPWSGDHRWEEVVLLWTLTVGPRS